MSGTKKIKGGARPGAGRKKSEAKAAVEQAIASTPVSLDGRTVGGKEHAQWLIEQLNKIDPVMMTWFEAPVSDEPIEIPKDATADQKKQLEKIEADRKERWALRVRAQRYFHRLTFEIQGWARIWFAGATCLDVRKYLHDKAAHQAVKIINHVHDKPIEHHISLSLSERFRVAMQKGEERVRNGRAS